MTWPLPTSASRRPPHGSKSLIVQQSRCPGREAPGEQQQRGTGFSEPAWKRLQPQETKLPLLSLSQPAPLLLVRWGPGGPDPAPRMAPARAGRVCASLCSSGQATRRALLPTRPRAASRRSTHPAPVSTSGHSQRQRTEASEARRSHAVLALAQLPRMQGQPSRGRTGLQHSTAGPGGHTAAQPVIFKPQTLSSAVISLSPLARPGGWPGGGGSTPAAQGLPGPGRKGPSVHPAPLEAM